MLPIPITVTIEFFLINLASKALCLRVFKITCMNVVHISWVLETNVRIVSFTNAKSKVQDEASNCCLRVISVVCLQTVSVTAYLYKYPIWCTWTTNSILL